MNSGETLEHRRRLRVGPLVVVALTLATFACQGKQAEQSSQKQRATLAKTQMFESLSGRLKQVISEDGVAAAVAVCANEAPSIAKTVADARGVRIGRTSSQLRNPANDAPSWAAPSLEKKPSEPTFVALPDGALGALFPIRLKQMCENCHGETSNIAEPVRLALAKHYPTDQATGYKEGDLRGWFWVEVPK